MHTLLLAQFMTRGIETLPPHASMVELVDLMAEQRLSCVVIVESGRPIGIISERDCVKWLRATFAGQQLAGVPVSEAMTAPVVTVGSDISWLEALEMVRRRRIRRLPVVDADGMLVGLVTQSDLLQAQKMAFQLQREELEVAIAERTRDLVLARDAAESALNSNVQLLATMTHEIRSPLSGVISMAELLGETDLSKQQEEWVGTIAGSGRALAALVDDILDYAKMESTTIEVEQIPFSLLELLEEVSDLCALKAQSKGVELRLVYDPTAPLKVISDPVRIRQLVTNLCSNAVKFTERGEVSIHLEVLEADTTRARMRVEVRDTGIGIAPDRRARLFEAYAQADASITRRFGGTGLGLAICKKLTEALGGEIGVESTPDVGSTFWFEIDVTLQEAAAPAPVATSDACVFIVDPNPSTAADLRRMLAGLGVVPTHYESAASADDAFSRGIRMQAAFVRFPLEDRIDGRRLDDLRTKAQGAPVYLVTDIADHALAASMTHRGYAGALTRPVKRRPLHDALANLVPVPELSEHARRSPPRQHHLAHDGARILLAEDNPVNQMVVRQQLRKLGYGCTVVDDGEGAVSAFRERAWDLVLLDYRMPGMDGPEVARKLRAIERERGAGATKVMAFSAGSDPREREICLAAGMDAYVRKPIQLEHLEELLSTHLPDQKQAPLSPMQVDAICELMNIGVGLGAASLSEMLEVPIDLHVPSVSTVLSHEFLDMARRFEQGEWTSVQLGFGGALRGSSALMLSETGVRSLVQALEGDGSDPTAPTEPGGVTLGEQVVAEVGNIVLNALIGAFTNTLNASVDFDVPACHRGSVQDILASDQYFDAATLLMARTHLVIRDLEVEGVVLVLLGLSTFEQLLDLIDHVAA